VTIPTRSAPPRTGLPFEGTTLFDEHAEHAEHAVSRLAAGQEGGREGIHHAFT